MKTWTVTAFGREIVKVEMREESTIADVVRHLVARRLGVEEHEIEVTEGDEYGDLNEGLIPCECCGEMFDPDDDDEDDDVEGINATFADITEQLFWGKPSEKDPDEED